VSPHETITAQLAPNQVYTYFDVANASIGFGSNVAGRGYPVALAGTQDNQGGPLLDENSSVAAVSDIMRTPANAAKYTPATSSLKTDLTNETVLSGAASSCVSFDPITSMCSNLTPVALKTDHGDLLLFEPYTVEEPDATPPLTQPYSVNWGFFWSVINAYERDD
jgi:hypothetical protein